MIPSSIQYINDKCFVCADQLSKFNISHGNKNFKYINDSLLLYKKNEESNFYELICVSKKAERIVLPKCINMINKYAFFRCNNLSYFEIEKGSQLSYIPQDTLYDNAINTIVIPWSLSNIISYVKNYNNIIKIGITDEEIKIDQFSFYELPNLSIVSFPNAKNIKIEKGSRKLKYFRPLRSNLLCDDQEILKEIRGIYDECIIANPFPSKDEELEFLQKKILNQ